MHISSTCRVLLYPKSRKPILKLCQLYTLAMTFYTEVLNLMWILAAFVCLRLKPLIICFTSVLMLKHFGLIFTTGSLSLDNISPFAYNDIIYFMDNLDEKRWNVANLLANQLVNSLLCMRQCFNDRWKLDGERSQLARPH